MTVDDSKPDTKSGFRPYDQELARMVEDNLKPDTKNGFKPPVKWLLGRQLLMGLKWILLYAIFKGKLDPRDWMSGKQYPGTEEFRAEKIEPCEDGTFTPADVEKFWKASNGEFWFDYLADSGDGQTATYTVAYLCGGNLSVTAKPGELPTIGSPVGFVRCDKNPADLPTEQVLLPTGRFLMIGGDTAYHISDYATLADRFQSPFRWAMQDLVKDHAIKSDDPRRPLFGIPANHDYYDIIDGFNRQFRRTTSPDGVPNKAGKLPQLSIPGFERCQTASYVALRLPFDWHLWGFDCEVDRMDIRQQEFFRSLYAEGGPDKLIIATPEPTTVFGKRAQPSEDPYPLGANDRMAQAFADLKLERPFLEKEKPLSPSKIRLDLSGDIHHYERYWGPDSGHDPDCARPKSSPPSSTNYASVVAGLGGAFLHPTQTYYHEIARQILYPEKDDSRNKIAAEIFNFWQLIREGYVWLLGIILASVIYAAGTLFQSSSLIFRHVFENWLGMPFSDTSAKGPLGLPTLARVFAGLEQGLDLSRLGIFLRMVSIVLSLAAVVAALFYARRIFSFRIPDPKEKWTARFDKDGRRTIRYRDFWPLAALILFAKASLLFGGWYFARHHYDLPQFGASLLVFVTILWAVAAIAASRMYSAWLFRLASSKIIKFRYHLPAGILTVGAIGALASGIAIFGYYPGHFLVADLLFIGLMFVMAVGLPVFAFTVGGTFSKVRGKLGFAVLGVWHLVLLLVTPFLLVAVGSWRAVVIAFISIFVFRLLGRALAKRKHSALPLLLTWLLFGAWIIYLPIKFSGPFLPLAPGMLRNLLLIVVAGLIGMFLTCVWFGWYLAVSLAFDGHNNEAGVAVTIEEYKQFVRVRLTKDSLTAFVIGVDKPATEGSTLEPKIVDVFTLRGKSST